MVDRHACLIFFPLNINSVRFICLSVNVIFILEGIFKQGFVGFAEHNFIKQFLSRPSLPVLD